MEEMELLDRVIAINRTAKVVKGGRRFRFSAVVVVGDGKGSVGAGLGKAHEVPEAIRKGMEQAKKAMVRVAIENRTIPYSVIGHFGAGKVLLKPASRGTGIIAGGSVRAVLEAAGVKDILTKSLGSANRINVARATMIALSGLKNPAEEMARRKGPAAPAPAAAGKPEQQAVTSG